MRPRIVRFPTESSAPGRHPGPVKALTVGTSKAPLVLCPGPGAVMSPFSAMIALAMPGRPMTSPAG